MELYIQKTADDSVESIDETFPSDGKTAFDTLRKLAGDNIIAGVRLGNMLFELSTTGKIYYIRYYDEKDDHLFETKNRDEVVELINKFIRKQKIKRPKVISFIRILSSLIPCAGLPVLFCIPLSQNYINPMLSVKLSIYLLWGGGLLWTIVHGELPVNLSIRVTRVNNPIVYYAFLVVFTIMFIQAVLLLRHF